MIEKLKELHSNCYTPYSHFNVSCILVMKDGKEISGVNVENASYGATICAERNAITTAVTHGYKKGDFKEIHVLCSSNNVGMPCFMCRQLFVEFFDNDTNIICYSSNGEIKSYTLNELCNNSFEL